ncbi:MAG: DnaJ domain-containing protein [Candidatus Caenarcaniphilales bacterium]|nr:DnaJ domain-containing protein [Candidatus Caenarcaniphilales bacterium]
MINLNMDFKDYYKTLNIGVGATDEAVKKAYKKLAKQYHPDSDGGSEEKFKEIQEAYEVLKDKNRRSTYDNLYKSHKNSQQSSYKSSSGGFGSGSNNSSYSSNSQQQKAQNDNKSAYDYYKKEAQKARENQAKESQAKQEQSNYGKQKPQDSYQSSHRSYQQKQYTHTKKQNPNESQNKEKKQSKSSSNDNNFSDFFNMFFGGESKSSTKTSRGDDYELAIELDLEDAYHGCTRKLEISSTGQGLRRLEVIIPAGVKDGNKIKIAGEGKIGFNGGENGDLYLKIRIKEHPLYEIEGDDIHSKLYLEPYEAILGTEKEVATLGSKVEIVIPPQTQNGKILRLKHRGLPNAKSKEQGDHYVHTEIRIKDHYSFEELQHYKAIHRINEL